MADAGAGPLAPEHVAQLEYLEATIKETWALQPRFEQRSGQRAYRLLEHPRFRAGYDFPWLRCVSGEIGAELSGLAEWWDRFQHADHAEREKMLLPDEGPKKRRRSRSRGRKRKEAASDGGGAIPDSGPEH